MIDYARMQRTMPKHKAALTKACKVADAQMRSVAVRKAVVAAVTEWNEIGAWPDDWHRWNIAVGDHCPAFYDIDHLMGVMGQ